MPTRKAPPVSTLLRELRLIRHHFTPDATAVKRALLTSLASARTRSLTHVVRLHEDLLFLRAFPDNEDIRAVAGRLLQRFERRVRALPRAARARLNDSGIAGSSSLHEFAWPVARWLAARFPREVEISWRDVGDTAGVDTLLRPALQRAEADAFDSGEITTAKWIRAARGRRFGSDLEFLVHHGEHSTTARGVFGTMYEAASVPLQWKLSHSRGAVTHNEWSRARVVPRSSMRSAPADPVRHVTTPLHEIGLLAPERARELIDVARAALAARCREVHAISWANPREVWLANLGEGASLAIIGALPDQRLSLEANYGYLLLANGVPMGYGGVTPLFQQANTGINIFEPFRRSEAGFLWTQMLRAFHSLFGVRRFVVNAYQFGEGNREAIASGAFWFYYRLGFRPAGADIRAVAAAEWARMRARAGYRSSAATLRRLATGDLHLTLPGFRATAFIDESWLITCSTRVTALLAAEDAPTREAAAKQVASRIAEALGVRDRRRWPVAERDGFDILAPVVALLPKLRAWSALDRQQLVELMRAKGRPQERDYAVLAHRHPRFFRELGAVQHSTPEPSRRD